MKPSELKERLGKGEKIRLIDIRETDEYAQAEKFEGSENVPMGALFSEAFKGKLSKEQKIIAVCRVGTKAEIIARELKQKGYDIDYLEGGVEAWNKSRMEKS